MYVEGTPVGENNYELFCVSCRKSLTVMPKDEVINYIWYITETRDIPLCFDCEEKFASNSDPDAACLVSHISTNQGTIQWINHKLLSR